MKDMRTPLLLLGLALCALPLFAQQPARRVVAPCELTTASLTVSDQVDGARQFGVLVRNQSTRTIALPRSPVFGWRVEVQSASGWKLKAEGGPVRRISAGDSHIVVSGPSGSAPMVEIPPAHSQLFSADLPEAVQALHASSGVSTLRLTLYWAAPGELALRNPALPVCALAPELVLKAFRS
jgi:hypothetical protein